MSFTKNLKPLTKAPPKPVITWDKHERIARNKEIWANKDSIVHRLPKHYQENYWKDILMDAKPVHYRPPLYRFHWDDKRKVEIETEVYPIVPEHCPEQDQGLWGGEGIVRCYIESGPKLRKKILPRHWIPRLYFPHIREALLYSEILNKHMKVMVTERTLRFIDEAYGLDNYLLSTANIDLNSKLGVDLKRQLLLTLAKKNYYPDDSERHEYVKAKYAKYVIPLEEAEWYGLDLNTAARKQQDIEDNHAKVGLKYVYEQELVEQLRGKDVYELEDDKFGQPQESRFGERMLGNVIKDLMKRAAHQH